MLHFAVDCLFIVSFCVMMLTHYRLFYLPLLLYGVYSRKFLQKKHKPKTEWWELTALETIAWFAIAFSALWIGFFAIYKGLLGNPTVMLPIGIIGLAIRSLAFAKEWGALRTSALVSN